MNFHIKNKLLITLLALTCGCLTVYSFARLFGELSSMGPVKAMQQWSSDGRIGGHPQRQKQLSRLLMSAQVSPWSADRSMDLARFYTWHLHRVTRGSKRHQIYAQRTQQQILDSLRARPSWGLAWAALAENSVVSGQYDSVINHFIDRALHYGPYEPGTLNKIATVGMLHWQRFPQSAQSQIRTAITRLLQVYPNSFSLIRLAFSLQWQEHLLPLLQSPQQRGEFALQVRRQES